MSGALGSMGGSPPGVARPPILPLAAGRGPEGKDPAWAGDTVAVTAAASPPRTPADVRAAADALFFDPIVDQGRTIHLDRDARDVASPGDAARGGPARAQILANEGMEATLLRTLGPDRQVQYQRVAAMIASDPLSRLALQVLLVEAKLKGKKAHGGQDLLETLDRLACSPVAPGLDRPTLVRDLIREIATPTAISQQFHGTCSVTSLQIKMATENPAEYARIVGGLASPEGRVRLASGATLSRLAGTEHGGSITQVHADGTRATALDPRTPSSRLWQAALTQFSYGFSATYDNATDRVVRGQATPGSESLSRAMGALSGQAPEVAHDWKLDHGVVADGREDLIARIQAEASPDHPVPVAMLYGEAPAFGHEVLVDQFKDGQVRFTNPWGMEEHVSVAEFKRRIVGGYAHLGRFDS